MSNNINDIARMMNPDDIKVLSLEDARNLLVQKSHKDTSKSLEHAVKLDYMLGSFIMGGSSIGEVREAAENLSKAIDDDLGLAYALTMTPEADHKICEDHEFAPMGSTRFVDIVHNLMGLARGYLSGNYKGEMLCETGLEASRLCFNAYRNASAIETSLGSGFCMDQNSKPAVDTFDKLMVETVSTGAIGAVAIRPAILGDKKRPKDIFPKKKDRWYLKYAIE